MRISALAIIVGILAAAPAGAASAREEEEKALKACAEMVLGGFMKIAPTRDVRFEGKVGEATALCRGGQKVLRFKNTPWVDWSNYWGAGDLGSRAPGLVTGGGPSLRGVTGALLDLEYQRIELIKFNLFENSGTYRQYVQGRGDVNGPALKTWAEMRLPKGHPNYGDVGGDGKQECKGDLLRWRTLSGICNDVVNPAMGSTGQLFMRNVEFDSSFPDLGRTELVRNRHGNRLGPLRPDPQVISRKLFTRAQSNPAACNQGKGLPGASADANCDYKKAPFFNVLAAFWIQFMTHDWFSHMEEGHNDDSKWMPVGCETKLVDGVAQPLTAEEIQRLGCRPGDRIDKGYVAADGEPAKFAANGKVYPVRAPKIYKNNNTAWWDASQIYGFDETSRRRVKLDPKDEAKFLLVSADGKGPGYLPVFADGDPILPQWKGQEAAAFADNWTIGISFLHNLFVREHNAFVDQFRKQARLTPNADSGLRNPAAPSKAIRYRDVTPRELFECARLVVTAEIAKIHTTEWTPQLLYNEPMYKAMNANWNGLLGPDGGEASKALAEIVTKNFGKSKDVKAASQWYSVFASGPGIFGLGSKAAGYDITKPAFTNGGVNHFGAPFNFPEEFVTVYRLHALVPDLLEYRDLKNPNKIAAKPSVVETFQGKATEAMRSKGIANWALTMGRQRLGLLELGNTPAFMQNIEIPRLKSETGKIDIAALDLIRDREHGVPRFNEFRRQYGLRQLTGFDDFIDKRLPPDAEALRDQWDTVRTLREVYGQHVCDASKRITDAQVNPDGSAIDDCLGHPNGTLVDNIEDVDTVVGWLAESTRPHGFAISETQFVVFILNASRRLFSDRFLTSSFRPEFYTTMGIDWVNNNGPGKPIMEAGAPNGHKAPVMPFKRVLLRNIPELAPELAGVVNGFDPWARARGEYYSVDWKPRKGAGTDDSFQKK